MVRLCGSFPFAYVTLHNIKLSDYSGLDGIALEKAQDLQRAIYFSRDLKKITSFLEKALQAAHNVRCKLDVALDQSSLGRLIGECLETLPTMFS